MGLHPRRVRGVDASLGTLLLSIAEFLLCGPRPRVAFLNATLMLLKFCVFIRRTLMSVGSFPKWILISAERETWTMYPYHADL